MRKTTILALAGAAFSLAFAGVAAAQNTPAPAAPAATAPAAPAAGALTIDSPIEDLLNNAGAKAVLAKDMPKLLAYDQLDMIKSMSLRQISQYPQAELDDTKLNAIQTDLNAAASAK
ncbi:hypothetical protein [Phenylobacterium montanum]|uniref:Uncharacterized protein n=1 Tax=Phenylobacterium montanum TaxID=2823693 RepID=A0A975IVS5_9CAUL|nr:hypothetical protein [Caulobacter sp. S6]QUD88859.1 hypothetical protein KCG34_02930 [Caulobacter sp. S6]